ncbi:MAG: metal-dependent hydrolase [Thalassolituus sp.]|uniref:metal-dependent hydrolase n=1 Tax=Thalassolituus sp. TaxID=2030822 RepID=UPI003982298C
MSVITPEIQPRRMAIPFDSLTQRFFFLDNPLLSVFVGALSSTFPPGEAEFIASVRLYRDKVTSPELQEQIRGFIGQEGHHSHQHKRANEVLRDLGIDAVRLEKSLEREIKRRLHEGKAKPKFRLALTVGMEHLTAILAEHVLTNPEIFDGLDDSVKELLYWHAVEEIEHKAVAFDVFMSTEGDQAYLRRVLRFATLMFSVRISLYMVALLWWSKKRPTWRDIKEFYKFLFGKKGMISGVRSNYKDFFKAGFHPWDHENTDLIERWKKDFYREEHDQGRAKTV